MRYDATLKKLFLQPPNRLLSLAFGKPVTVKRMLPTDLIRVENLHPDLLLLPFCWRAAASAKPFLPFCVRFKIRGKWSAKFYGGLVVCPLANRRSR